MACTVALSVCFCLCVCLHALFSTRLLMLLSLLLPTCLFACLPDCTPLCLGLHLFCRSPSLLICPSECSRFFIPRSLYPYNHLLSSLFLSFPPISLFLTLCLSSSLPHC